MAGPQIQQTQAATKLSSTARMMKQFFGMGKQVFTRQSPNVQIIKLEKQAANLRNSVERLTSRVDATFDNIRKGIEKLRENRDTTKKADEFSTQLGGLAGMAQPIEQDRKALAQDIQAYLATKEAGFKEIIALIEKKDQPKIKQKLEELERIQKNLSERLNKLNLNETALQEQLDKLHKDVYNVIPQNERGKVVAPAGVKEQEVSRARYK